MMKKIYVGALLVSMLARPVFGMEEHKTEDIHTTVRSPEEQSALNERLFHAVIYRDIVGVKRLLDEGADVNAMRWGKGNTVLCEAIEKGNIEVIQLLLDHKDIKVNMPNDSHITPLSRACWQNNSKLVQLLLARKDIDVNAPSESSPLVHACQKGNSEIVKLLLEREDIQVNGGTTGSTPLYQALFFGHNHLVRLLLARNDIDVNQASRGYLFSTPLHYACSCGNIEMVKILLAHTTIQVNVLDYNQETPLFKACSRGDTAIVELLLAHKGIQVIMSTNDVWSPLSIACHQGHSKIVRLLLKSFTKPMATWNAVRLLFVGHKKEKKENCLLALLPRDMVDVIANFCGDESNNIQKVKRCILHKSRYGSTAFDNARDVIKQEFGHILDPQSWQDDQTAQKTYDALLKVLKDDGGKKNDSNNSKQEQQ